MHSQGLIHCDLRPRNFLVDEYGILKLSDFKFTRKIPNESLQDTPMSTRGFVTCMAPELFTSEGMHSFQSDFWAIGCLLYQLRRGTNAFGDCNTMSTEQIVNNIRTIEPVLSPLSQMTSSDEKYNNKNGNNKNSNSHHNSIPAMTAELADLLMWLMEKSPSDRCSW